MILFPVVVAVAEFCVECPFSWGGREAHPAVANPVLVQENVISLRGEWEFSVPERDLPNRNGIWGNFNQKQKWGESRKIRVPGCWEEQGVGEQGMSEPWDATWDHCGKPIRHKHMGEGWYRKEVDIPSSWVGKRIWIKFGGVKSIGWVWVNDQQVALIDNYCATEKYEITDLVKPGERAKIVVDVDNRKPSRKGLMSATHRWGGIYRDVELEATPEVFIDDAWVRGDFDLRKAQVKVEIAGGQGSDSLSVRATVEGETKEVSFRSSPSPSDFTLEVPLRNFRPWSPERPNLYTAKVELVSSDGKVLQTRFERFGVRKLEVRGKELFLNGKPFYLRGFGDDFVYPRTGMSPCDRGEHRRHLRKAREAGFNFVRLHTHCELPEYFEAADEVGIMIQAELPYYSDVPTEGACFDPKRDVTELWRNYRRHPSFAVYSMGNEGSFGVTLDRRLHRYVKEMDPDRLKINQDTNRPELSSSDRSDYAGGPITTWERGSYDPDRPFVTHEFLNLCVKSDSRSEGKYTGAWMPPMTRSARAKWLAGFGLGHEWGDRLQDAQHVLQAVWQKRGIEAARLDPYCDGYIFWTIVDVVVWNQKAMAYSAQGLFDPFWDEKSHGLSAAEFAAFNSPSCVLADIVPDRRVFVSGESFRCDIHLAHYGDRPLLATKAKWSLSSESEILSAGTADVGEQPIGAVRKIASVDVQIPAVARPVKATLAVALGSVRNSWDVWVFPKGPSLAEIRDKAKRLGVAIVRTGSKDAETAVAEGRPFVSVGETNGAPNINLGWWWMGSQVGTAIRPHRALGSFPHEGALTPLLFRILKRGQELPVSGVWPEDMIMVGEGGEKCYLYLAERRIGKSRVLDCHGLDILSDLPEGNALLDSFVDELARTPPPRVVAFGDSITEGVIGIRPEENWMRLVQEEFGDAVRMCNAGVGGNSAREAMMRYDRDVLGRKPDVILLEFGGNNHDPQNRRRNVSDEEFKAILEDYASRVPNGVRVIAVTFPPIKDEWHAYGRHPAIKDGLDEAMQSQREILRSFARDRGWPIVDLYAAMKDRREEVLLSDGVHLNPVGQRVFADMVGAALKEIVIKSGK